MYESEQHQWSMLIEKANEECEKYNYKKSIELAKEALSVLQGCKGLFQEYIGATYSNLAVFYDEDDQLSLSEECYKKALIIFESLFGLNHPKTQMVATNYRLLLEEMGKIR